MTNFQLCYRSALPHGLLCGVNISRDPIDWDASYMAVLTQSEVDFAKGLKGLRQSSWIAGRIAAHHALSYYTNERASILSDPFGCPIAPKNYALSLTHKDKIAIAMVVPSQDKYIGIDFEYYYPQRLGISSKVLRTEELDAISEIPEPRQWISTLLHFSAKESIYKAIAPRLKRYIGFNEVALRPHRDGQIDIEWHLEEGPVPKTAEARYIWLEDGLITTTQITW